MADELAKRYCNIHFLQPFTKIPPYLLGFFDGNRKGNEAFYSWALFASWHPDPDSCGHWQLVASKSGVLPDGASITAAELQAAASLIAFVGSYVQGYPCASADISRDDLLIDLKAVGTFKLADLV